VEDGFFAACWILLFIFSCCSGGLFRLTGFDLFRKFHLVSFEMPYVGATTFYTDRTETFSWATKHHLSGLNYSLRNRPYNWQTARKQLAPESHAETRDYQQARPMFVCLSWYWFYTMNEQINGFRGSDILNDAKSVGSYHCQGLWVAPLRRSPDEASPVKREAIIDTLFQILNPIADYNLIDCQFIGDDSGPSALRWVSEKKWVIQYDGMGLGVQSNKGS